MKLFDFKCPRHGTFESSHAICPNFGCDSAAVEKVFLKPPGFKSDATKRFDDGMRKSAAMYNQSDWKTAKEGESAKANNRAAELKWGDDAAALLGRSAGETVGGAPGTSHPVGMAPAGWAPEMVKGDNPLARAERTGVKKQDDQWRTDLQGLVPQKPA